MTRSLRRPSRLLALACALAVGACNVPLSRDGLLGSFTPPGPNPTKVSGIETNVPPMTEENLVEVLRVAGRVQVRLAGERGPRDLQYYRPRIQTGPFGVVLLGPNSVARLSFPDDSGVVISDTALVRLGDPAKGEPRVMCSRLTHLDLAMSATAKMGPIELPGGARITAPPGAHVKVSLFRDRFYRVMNEGRNPITVAIAGRDYTVRPSEDVTVPVLLNEPEPAETASLAKGGE